MGSEAAGSRLAAASGVGTTPSLSPLSRGLSKLPGGGDRTETRPPPVGAPVEEKPVPASLLRGQTARGAGGGRANGQGLASLEAALALVDAPDPVVELGILAPLDPAVLIGDLHLDELRDDGGVPVLERRTARRDYAAARKSIGRAAERGDDGDPRTQEDSKARQQLE
jgi:hypothetical protein